MMVVGCQSAEVCGGRRAITETCGLPQEQRFSFRVPAAFTVMADMGPGEGRVPSMNGASHFQELTARRQTFIIRQACSNI